jgi:hypothetical protein
MHSYTVLQLIEPTYHENFSYSISWHQYIRKILNCTESNKLDIYRFGFRATSVPKRKIRAGYVRAL